MKTFFINGLKVTYEVSKTGVLLVSLYNPYSMTDAEKKKTIASVANYLIAEGFVKLPIDNTEIVE
jgi:agmatine/peptidylarginine deiminase